MAVDQNSVAKDLRPLSGGRKVVDDPRLASVHGVPASGGVASSPMSRLGFERDAPFWGCDPCEAGVHDGSAESSVIWNGQVMPPPPAGDFQGNWVRGDAMDQPSSGEPARHLSNEGSSSRHGGSGGAGCEDSSSGAGSGHDADTLNSGNGLGNVEGLDDSGAKKVKFLCSFGGKILPRPSDGMLRYVGGQTRIISTRKGVSYQELMHKMQEAYGQSVVIKYQLPNEDLDALVSVSCDEDVENMMEEYDRLLAGPVDASSSSKLRLFLFSADEIDQSGIMQFGDEQDSGQRYVEAVNGIMPETAIKRKDSVSTINSDGLPGGGDVTDATPTGQIDTGAMAPPSPSLITLSPVSSDAACLPYLHSNNPLGFTEVPVAGGKFPIAPPMRQQDDGIQVTKPLNSTSGLDSRSEMVSFELQNMQNAGHTNTFKGVHKDLHGRPDYRSYLDPDILSNEFASQPASQISHLDAQMVRNAALGYRLPDHLLQQPGDIVGVPPNPFHAMQAGYVVSGTTPSSQHIVSTSSSPQANMSLNIDQHFVPLMQIQTEQFPERSLVGTGVQGNLVYQAPQLQAATQLSGQPSKQLNALHQIPLPDHLCPEGWGGLHSGILPERATKLEDCYMCQKALSHVHSDTHLQENGYDMKSVYESNPAIHSCYSEGSVKPGSPNWPSRPTVQATVECQATGNWQKSVANNDHVTAYHMPTHVSGPYKFCQMPEEQYDPDLILQPKVEKFNCSGLLPPRDQGIMLDIPSMSRENHGLVPEGPNESVSKKFAVVLPSAEIEKSYGQLNNPSQSHQDVLQSFGQPGSHVKQDLRKDAFGLIDTSASTGVPFTIIGSSSQDSLAELPSRHRPVSPSEGFSPPTYSRATEGITEALSVNPSKPMLSQQYKPPFDLNSAPPKEDSMKCKLLDAGLRLSARQGCTTVDSNAIIANEEILPDLPSTSVNRKHIISPTSQAAAIFDENCIKPIDPLATNSTHDVLVQNIQPQVSNSISHLQGQHGSFPDLESHCEPTLSTDPWNGLTAPQCISSMYGTGKDMGSAHVLEEDALRGGLGNLAVPSVGVSFPLDVPSNNGKWEGEFLDPLASRLPSSTCISDPWDLVQDAAANLMPAIKPVTPKVFVPTDAYKHSFSEICGSLGTSLEVEKLSLSQQSNMGDEARSNNDLCLEHFPGHEDAFVDDPVKKELQAVAEDVATSVLQSSLTGSPVLSTSPVLGVGGEERNDDVPLDSVQTSVDSMAECFRAKILEISRSGLPLSEDIGRLQIIKNSDLEELRELGSGTFGTVYHGKWRGSDVAIKRINDRCFSGKPSEQQRMRTDFWNEACKLSDLHHPNVVAFYGVVLDGPGGTVATVTEYMVNGSLRQALHKNNRIRERRNRIYIAMDVAFGMEYLHGKNIVHFDLKSDNLLVNLRDPQRPICKVGDLGLSKVKRQTLISGGVRGTLPWMAPELLNGSSTLVSEKVDVFSFGIVMWELLTGEEPYADLHYGAIIGGIVGNRLRPQVPDHCDSDWKSLMEKCWSTDPSDRPSFTEIASTLRSMAAVQQSKGQNSQPQVQK
ncbi:uncharacterized protein LOC116250101 isoform X2 [Nymphaea colorata]|uniref:uncharacterized protein LOC116250101 isoform X2 n=1 Tax=Nymphaea colorata TaxID=210225 RepID=UPI00129D8F10|nr:uncharacterized protein LOC116250101 isoform X2 [Nymphaea colorata]